MCLVKISLLAQPTPKKKRFCFFVPFCMAGDKALGYDIHTQLVIILY